MRDHKDLERRLTLYVLGELSRKDESELEAHLAECQYCREEEACLDEMSCAYETQ